MPDPTVGQRGESGFAIDLAREKAERLPVMALRPDQDVQMFRAEAMSEDSWWLCCYFAGGERVTFDMSARCRPRALVCTVGEWPSDWKDLDADPMTEKETK